MKNKFAQNLKSLRIMNNMSQQDLSKNLGLSISAISMYENGNREPNINQLIKIATYFQVSLDQLIGLADLER